MSDLLTFENDTFASFAFYSGLVLGKTILMGPLTAFSRVCGKVYSNPEDTRFFAPGTPVNTADPWVERVRRCHQNDIENVVPFTLIGLFYVCTKPDPHLATNLFRVFAASRLLHTIAYLTPLPQPARATCFVGGIGVMGAMAAFVIQYTNCHFLDGFLCQ